MAYSRVLPGVPYQERRLSPSSRPTLFLHLLQLCHAECERNRNPSDTVQLGKDLYDTYNEAKEGGLKRKADQQDLQDAMDQAEIGFRMQPRSHISTTLNRATVPATAVTPTTAATTSHQATAPTNNTNVAIGVAATTGLLANNTPPAVAGMPSTTKRSSILVATFRDPTNICLDTGAKIDTALASIGNLMSLANPATTSAVSGPDGAILCTPSPWSCPNHDRRCADNDRRRADNDRRRADNDRWLRQQRAQERHIKWDNQWRLANEMRTIIVEADKAGDRARVAEVKPRLTELEDRLMQEMADTEEILESNDADNEGGMNTLMFFEQQYGFGL
jgi:hypothetical protein